MRKLILQQWISLDGCIADANGGLDFFTKLNNEGSQFSDLEKLKFLEERIDLFILGRTTYKLFVEYWPTDVSKVEVISEKLNSLPKAVVSNTLKHAPWGKWPEAQIISGDVAAQIIKLKSLPGKDIIVWGSLELSHFLLKNNLFDEIHFQICPVIVGDGMKQFGNGIPPNDLELKNIRTYGNGVMFVEYNVRRKDQH